MKKSLIALAVLAASGAAMAQSSVTLFGVVDASVARIVNSGGSSNTGLANSGYNSSRLGFRGTEDLGGGLSASFWLEGQLGNDAGTAGAGAGGTGLNFQRRSTVSLAGAFGEIRLGRDYTPTFWNETIFDPFGTNGVGTTVVLDANGAQGVGTLVRASNTVGYFLPRNLGGFYGQVMYAFDETPSAPVLTEDAGRYIGGRVGYAAGPLNLAVSYGVTEGTSPAGFGVPAGTTPDYKLANFGGSYDFGFLQLMGYVSRLSVEGAPSAGERDVDGYLLGLTAPVGPGQIRFAYSRAKTDLSAGADPRASKLALGYVYNLSKRTAVYTTVARTTNKNGSAIAVATNGVSAGAAVSGRRSSGYEFGVRHAF